MAMRVPPTHTRKCARGRDQARQKQSAGDAPERNTKPEPRFIPDPAVSIQSSFCVCVCVLGLAVARALFILFFGTIYPKINPNAVCSVYASMYILIVIRPNNIASCQRLITVRNR